MALDNEDIKQLIAILQRGLESEPKEDAPKPKTKRKTKDTNSNSTNKFLQMPESRMHKEDVKIDKLLNKNGPTPRLRTQFKPIEAKCRSCGKVEKINPGLIHDSIDRYKCNVCSTSAG